MTIAEAAAILNCNMVCGAQNKDRLLNSACGADLMSDVLAFVKEDCLLLTGMVNAQVVRTAEMLDVPCIVFVRGKVPSEDMIELAEQTGVTLLTCEYTLYEACGRLYQNGLPPCRK
jgi:predicted transcriptional regulator